MHFTTNSKINYNLSSTLVDEVWLVRRLEVDDFLHKLVVAKLAYCSCLGCVLWIHQPAVVERDLQQVKNDALLGILKVTDTTRGPTNIRTQE